MMIEKLISDKFGAMINQTKKFSFKLWKRMIKLKKMDLIKFWVKLIVTPTLKKTQHKDLKMMDIWLREWKILHSFHLLQLKKSKKMLKMNILHNSQPILSTNKNTSLWLWTKVDCSWTFLFTSLNGMIQLQIDQITFFNWLVERCWFWVIIINHNKDQD